jgi:chaperonin cofactor prefoldin
MFSRGHEEDVVDPPEEVRVARGDLMVLSASLSNCADMLKETAEAVDNLGKMLRSQEQQLRAGCEHLGTVLDL